MINNGRAKRSDGIGLGGLLGVLFITLKLCNVIDWSWWWVLSPFWMPPVFILVVGLLIVLIASLAELQQRRKKG
jgi:hypothetical protein